MSVAFRRESDEEHLEPRFELPIPPGPNLVTPRGRDLIAARVDALEASAAAEPDAEARKPIQRELRYWRTRLATAESGPATCGRAKPASVRESASASPAGNAALPSPAMTRPIPTSA